MVTLVQNLDRIHGILVVHHQQANRWFAKPLSQSLDLSTPMIKLHLLRIGQLRSQLFLGRWLCLCGPFFILLGIRKAIIARDCIRLLNRLTFFRNDALSNTIEQRFYSRFQLRNLPIDRRIVFNHFILSRLEIDRRAIGKLRGCEKRSKSVVIGLRQRIRFVVVASAA